MKNYNALNTFILLATFTTTGCIEKVATHDEINRYEFAEKQQDKNRMCFQAKLITELFFRAEDTENYKKWKKTSEKDCNI